MSGRYLDPAVRERAHQLGGKVMRAVREAKCAEARQRDTRTVHEATRAHRTGRCGCQPPPHLEPGHAAAVTAACPHPEKDTYPTGQAAAFVLVKLARRRRTQGLHPYPCPAGGHWHLGRDAKRPPSTWKRAA